jgi:elongation factor P
MKSNEDVEVTEVTECNCQYMYADDENYYFMESESFEQFAMPRAGMEDKIYYIREGEEYRVIKWEGNPVDIKLPPKMVFVVAEGSEGIKGDTVTKTTKPVKTETGLVVKVPLFIKEGEKILVSTDTGEYQERVNK